MDRLPHNYQSYLYEKALFWPAKRRIGLLIELSNYRLRVMFITPAARVVSLNEQLRAHALSISV